MKPEILVMAPSPSAAVMAQLDEHFHCHHLWRVAAPERDAWLAGVAPRVRGLATTGTIGIDAALAARLPLLEIVAVNGIGVDAVDFAALRPRGIRVTNTPGVLTDDVADLAVALLLAAGRRIPALDTYVRAGRWQQGVAIPPARAVRGKVAGIYGFGRIGKAVAQRLAAFGLQLRYWQPNVVAGTDVPRSASLLDLARDSDYLVVCAPGGAATKGLIDADVLAALGPEGTLVNVARGSIVDEPALVAALEQGRLGAAALDVFAEEPAVPQALMALPNVVLTPHVGSLTVETRQAMGQLVVDNLLAHFAGRDLLTPVA
ncbi:lactate dehydrogenase-like 2-hydroxyacid dehydrogenase [Pseudoduganella flava]|uniref:2-hydroxyacid dehydrogenase n=1 Tax=Pseudoduganella flava TaxID=871742 RepID=A0A562PKK9_9BURK|nr:2-hydroxyacid dehydrogenase [Pseudoduganella flava]QGZ42438.1 2-hydroxyacid dehydrogenase [Pseudoduganella flava]TWI45005.1 lactate dehydrogenase-like 2-hydroxyacid dehydrogenase [Pseudoduganella flava]